MSEDEGGGSTGLVIGMIIGGVVVLLVIAAVVFGAGFLFMARDVDMPVGMEEDVAVAHVPIDDPLVGIIKEGPLAKAPEPEDVRKARERLVGVWLGDDIGKRRPSLEFRADGTARWLWPSAAGPETMEASDDAWEVQEAEKDRLKVRFFANLNKQLVYEHQLRFDGDDRLIIVGPLTDARMIVGKDGNAVYQRKPAEKKP
jgi:hypothetical protein